MADRRRFMRARRTFRRGSKAALSALLLGAATPGAGAAQDTSRAALPFGVGELVSYDVKFGPLRVGRASMEVVGRDSVRDRVAWHLAFRVQGRALFYAVDDLHESWIDTTTLASLRFVQKIHEGRRRRHRKFEIYPDRAIYTDGGDAEHASVSEPLDDGSFLYFVRTLPLEVGQTYELHRYFRPDRNPVTIRVLRRERVTVPAGTFEAIVVQPIIKTRGIFSEGGEAEVWLSDDEARVVVQMKAKLSFGTLELELRSFRAGGAAREKLAATK